ncbi:MAG: hypothetical protein PUB07_06945 [Clostridia bacterium]|nr:hypothetical protein [Clostridia bacterium]
MKEDLLRLFSYYEAQGLSPAEIENRVGGDIFGSFYTRPSPALWYPLDSAAKIYPLALTSRRMTKFRVSAYLKDPVEPCVLQVALLSTIKRFPVFATNLRRGFFWHYLDALRCRFEVHEESRPPCSYLSQSRRRTPCFEVLYYKKRIALEVFHVLTDGGGAMVFLKTLIAEYLRLLGVSPQYGAGILDVQSSPSLEEQEDSFLHVISSKGKGGFMQPFAVQPGEKRRKDRTGRILQFIMPADALIRAAHKRDISVTGFLTACMFAALYPAVAYAKPNEPLQIQVPINLRSRYGRKTLRNFSLYAVLRLPYEKAVCMDDIFTAVREQLATYTEKTFLDGMLASAVSMAHNPILRFVPLGLKNMICRKIYGILGEKTLSATLSNIGVVHEDFGGKVEMFDAIIGTSWPTNFKCGLISYQGTAVLSIASSLRNVCFEDSLYRILEKEGIKALVEGTAI